ncbi:MAG: methyltransferase domain-containing protein [Proteobacteria bacterium]|nr:methyltransferase domain-containing protein [Pseudomonadota bacterium]
MKNVINGSFLFIFLAFHSSLFAITEDDLKKWVPTRLHSPHILKQLAKEIDAESQTRIPTDPSPIKKDYGFSFPHISPPLERVLIEIKTRYETTGVRPRTLDAGPGTGLGTRKIVIAGGEAVPLELNKAAAIQLQRNLLTTKPYLLKESVREVCPQIFIDNVMNFESKAYSHPFDVTYSANLIHFLSPEDAQSYVKQLFKVTKPGGLAVATANAPSYFPCVIDLWRENRDLGNPFPGNMVKDLQVLRIVDYDGDNKKVQNELDFVVDFWRTLRETGHPLSTEEHQKRIQNLSWHERKELNVMTDTVAAHSPQNNDLYPGTGRNGFYSNPQEKEEWKFIVSTNIGSYTSREEHLAFHYFDTETLSKLFSDAGFTVKAAYYLSGNNEKILPDAMTDEQLDASPYNSVVEAYKPDSQQSEFPTTAS